MRKAIALLMLLALSGNAAADNYQATDEGDARTVCEQSRAKIASKYAATCIHIPEQKDYFCKGTGDVSGYSCDGLVPFFPSPKPTNVHGHHYYQTGCAARPDAQLRQNMSVLPTVKATECSKGCLYNVNQTPNECYQIEDQPGTSDDPKVGYNCRYDVKATGQSCDGQEPPDKPPPEPPEKCEGTKTRLANGDCVDRGACPVGQHKVGAKCEPDGACPTGKVKAPDSSCVDEACPAGQAKASDGTCKKDDDGDGEPNEGEDTGKFSGGEDCKTPPQCSGDNILCGQARIQWRIDCNTRRNDTINGGGNCSSAPVCSGEKCSGMEYSQLIQQWRTACATERLASGVTPGAGSAQPDWTKVGGMNQDPGAGSATGDTKIFSERTVDATDVNTTPIVGGGGTCPGFPVSGGGSGWTSEALGMIASPPAQWCDTIKVMHDIILLFALIAVIYINVKG